MCVYTLGGGNDLVYRVEVPGTNRKISTEEMGFKQRRQALNRGDGL